MVRGWLLCLLCAVARALVKRMPVQHHTLPNVRRVALEGLRMSSVGKYCEDTTRPRRRPTRTCQIGKVPIGSQHPIAKQTMTTTVTKDVEGSVEQILKIAKEGADLVRLTVQGRFEADACMKIRESLWEKKCDIPLVADIHFAPAVAIRVAEAFEKVRINPGNFADGIKSFENRVYNTREEYDQDVAHIEELLLPLIQACKDKNRAMRIGTNHGSLSARVMSFWGDSPRGMVESAIEFANICRKHDFHNFLFSMKVRTRTANISYMPNVLGHVLGDIGCTLRP